jgi:hypothetical protein
MANTHRIAGQDLTTAQVDLVVAGLRRDALEHGIKLGDRKVFLGSIPSIDLADPDCRAWLDDLRRTGRVEFVRADFVAAMDPALVAASEWTILHGVTAHFLMVA